MNKNQRAFNKKLLISDGHQSRYIDAHTLSEIAAISIKHAYRLIAHPEKITPTIQKLVQMQLLGTVPNWPSGWRFQDGKLYGPRGYAIEPHIAEEVALFRCVERDYIREIKALKAQIAALQDELKKPRLVIDNPKPARRVLRVVK